MKYYIICTHIQIMILNTIAHCMFVFRNSQINLPIINARLQLLTARHTIVLLL